MAPRGRARVRDRLRGQRLSGRRRDAALDRTPRPSCSQAGRPRAISTCRYPRLGDAVPQPRRSPRRTGASSKSPRAAHGVGARARARASSTKASSPMRSTPSRSGRRAPRRATTSPRGAPRSSRSSRSTTAGLTVCKTGPWGAGPGRRCSSSRCSRASTSRDLGEAEFVPRRDRVRQARVRRPRRALRRRATFRSTRCSRASTTTQRRALVGDEASSALRTGARAPADSRRSGAARRRG